jgi:hypothetical protein
MVDRCHNPQNKSFRNYGGRGIQVCPEWLGNLDGLRRFVAWVEVNLGPRPEGSTASGFPAYTLDRVDNDEDYRPGNLRWATAGEQRRNRRPARCQYDGLTDTTPEDGSDDN